MMLSLQLIQQPNTFNSFHHEVVATDSPPRAAREIFIFNNYSLGLFLFGLERMSITNNTKQAFQKVLSEELGLEMPQVESDHLLKELVQYYRHIGTLMRKVESPQKSQN